jgi:hypothetical protein
MPTQLTENDVRESLSSHVAAKGEAIRAKYGPHIGWNELQRILKDRSCVRYPSEVVFNAQPLLPGECAHPVANGDRPEDGFTMHVHPFFMTQPQQAAYLVLYQLVVVNYGEFASPDDAELFGASVLGISRDEYYNTLCGMADQIACEPPH